MNENNNNTDNTKEENNELFKLTIIVFILIMSTMLIPILYFNINNSIPKNKIIKEYTYTENGETYKLTIEKLSTQ